MTDDAPINAVVTTLSIIERMARYGKPIGVSELSKLVDANKPRIYRHLRTLVQRRYVAQDVSSDKYYLTLKLFHIGQSIATGTEFLSEAQRVMMELGERTQMTVTIGQVEDDGVRILDILRHRSAIEISTPAGTLFDFHSSAQGKLALAYGAEDLWRKVRSGKLAKYTPRTITAIAPLEAAVAAVQQKGWAVAPEESLTGVNALAAPVFDANGRLVGTIAIVGSIQHLQAKPERRLIDAVQKAAESVSERLGYLPVKAS